MDICSNKHKGNLNSIEAHNSILPVKQSLLSIVLEAIVKSSKPLHFKEISEITGIVPHSVSGRLAELKKLKRIKSVGQVMIGNRPVDIYVENF